LFTLEVLICSKQAGKRARRQAGKQGLKQASIQAANARSMGPLVLFAKACVRLLLHKSSFFALLLVFSASPLACNGNYTTWNVYQLRKFLVGPHHVEHSHLRAFTRPFEFHA